MLKKTVSIILAVIMAAWIVLQWGLSFAQVMDSGLEVLGVMGLALLFFVINEVEITNEINKIKSNKYYPWVMIGAGGSMIAFITPVSLENMVIAMFGMLLIIKAPMTRPEALPEIIGE